MHIRLVRLRADTPCVACGRTMLAGATAVYCGLPKPMEAACAIDRWRAMRTRASRRYSEYISRLKRRMPGLHLPAEYRRLGA